MTESPEGKLPEKVARSFAEQMLSALQCPTGHRGRCRWFTGESPGKRVEGWIKGERFDDINDI